MTPTYKIHPAIGIARVGNSSEFYLAPEKAGGLPIQCNADGIATQPEQPVTAFKDDAGAIKRQAARFRVFVYDAAVPGGRELQINDQIQVLNQTSGQVMTGNLTDVSLDCLSGQQESQLVRIRANRRGTRICAGCGFAQSRHHGLQPAAESDH